MAHLIHPMLLGVAVDISLGETATHHLMSEPHLRIPRESEERLM